MPSQVMTLALALCAGGFGALVEEDMAAVACSECWPQLREELVAAGAHVSGCAGPFCTPGS